MLTPAEQYGFDCTGFFRRCGAVSGDTVARALGAIRARHGGGALPLRFPVMPYIGPVIYELLQHDLLAAVAAFCCGPQFRVDHVFGVGGGLPNLHGGPDCSQYSCFWQRAGDRSVLAGRLSIGVARSGATGRSYCRSAERAMSCAPGAAVDRSIRRGRNDDGLVKYAAPGDTCSRVTVLYTWRF